MSDTVEVGGGRVTVTFTTQWVVRSVFGGIVAAAAVRAARRVLGINLPLADGLFSFLAPTPPGPASIRVTPWRAGSRFAGADLVVESGGLATLRAAVSFAASAHAESNDVGDGSARGWNTPSQGSIAFDGAAEWSATAGWDDEAAAVSTPGSFTSWVRALPPSAHWAADEWACIAADMIGPALVPAVARPFAVATATMALSIHGEAPITGWWRQTLNARLDSAGASSSLELRTESGSLIARSRQLAVVLPAQPSEWPRSASAFAGSSIG